MVCPEGSKLPRSKGFACFGPGLLYVPEGNKIDHHSSPIRVFLVETNNHNFLIALQSLLQKNYSNTVKIGTFIAQKMPEG
jgi:hypothetical protein